MYAGLYGKLWDMNIGIIKNYISTHSWMFHIIAYNASYDIKISSPHATLGPQLHGDKAIMQLATDFFASPSELRSINRVRRSFEITYLSDISMANGRGLDINSLSNKEYKPKKNIYLGPAKHQLTKTGFITRKKLLKWIYPLHNYELYTSLKDWQNEKEWEINWDWHSDSSGCYLYHYTSKYTWHRHLKKFRISNV